MQFKLINTPAIFQKKINSILGEYLDNIIIYFNSKEEHFQYVKQVLQRLTDKKMPIAIKKCEFYITKTKFYKFIIELGKLNIDLKKVKVIVNQ